jgi:hypothetical protein
MDVVEPIVAEAGSHGAPTEVESSHHHGCNSLHACDRLPMARFAEGLSTVHDGSALLL